MTVAKNTPESSLSGLHQVTQAEYDLNFVSFMELTGGTVLVKTVFESFWSPSLRFQVDQVQDLSKCHRQQSPRAATAPSLGPDCSAHRRSLWPRST